MEGAQHPSSHRRSRILTGSQTSSVVGREKKINLIFVETRFAGTELVEHSSQPPSNLFLCSALELVVPILPLIFTPSTLCLLKSLEPLFFFPFFFYEMNRKEGGALQVGKRR